jgi:hypothetical protein
MNKFFQEGVSVTLFENQTFVEWSFFLGSLASSLRSLPSGFWQSCKDFRRATFVNGSILFPHFLNGLHMFWRALHLMSRTSPSQDLAARLEQNRKICRKKPKEHQRRDLWARHVLGCLLIQSARTRDNIGSRTAVMVVFVLNLYSWKSHLAYVWNQTGYC